MPRLYPLLRPLRREKDIKFRPYRPGETLGKVSCVTPDDGYYVHTFYDVCPFSPSQKYLAVTRLPYQDREPVFGDRADVCLIDLERQTIRTVYSTKAWGFQLGANLNWGRSDRYLYANEVINGSAVCVRIDIETGDIDTFAGPMYHIAPDESCVAGFPLDLINATQSGYGAPLASGAKAWLPQGAAAKEGIWKTNLVTNTKTLLLSLSDGARAMTDGIPCMDGTFYFFHTKFNRQNSRILQVMRCLCGPGPKANVRRGNVSGGNFTRFNMLLTFKPDGSDLRRVVSYQQWAAGGNHPNWHPDGEHIIMNLTPAWLGDQTMRFCMFRYDGTEFKVLADDLRGSGHPSMETRSRYLISDAYPHQPMARSNGEVPIRLVDVENGKEEAVCYIRTLWPGPESLRLDPHPVWSRDYRKVCFNGAPDGRRQVFIADLTDVI
jgi:hypothetical protein